MLKPKVVLSAIASFVSLIFTGTAFAAYDLNLPQPAAPLPQQIYDLHMLTTMISTIIMVVIIGVVVFAVFKFRKSKGYVADQNFHESSFGTWSWVLVPIIVLAIDLTIAIPASDALKEIEDYSKKSDVTIKITGSQWKWSYEYMDDDIQVVSNLLPKEKAGDNYLLAVDNPLVLPVNKRIRLLHTASDVIHAWWVPEIVYKKDAIPGYINETWTNITKEGTYRGQCAELCGTGHAFMPIVVEAVSQEKYEAWKVKQKQTKAAALAEASSDKVWTKDELMSKGKAVYTTSCAACHQTTGLGIPGVFAALKGGKISTGDKAGHIDIVLNGKSGTAMSAWGAQLNDLEIAAVITYERNAWGNNTNDTIQPADIKSARK